MARLDESPDDGLLVGEAGIGQLAERGHERRIDGLRLCRRHEKAEESKRPQHDGRQQPKLPPAAIRRSYL